MIHFSINNDQLKALRETGFCACFGVGGYSWIKTVQPGTIMIVHCDKVDFRVRVLTVQENEKGDTTFKDLVIAPAL